MKRKSTSSAKKGLNQLKPVQEIEVGSEMLAAFATLRVDPTEPTFLREKIKEMSSGIGGGSSGANDYKKKTGRFSWISRFKPSERIYRQLKTKNSDFAWFRSRFRSIKSRFRAKFSSLFSTHPYARARGSKNSDTSAFPVSESVRILRGNASGLRVGYIYLELRARRTLNIWKSFVERLGFSRTAYPVRVFNENQSMKQRRNDDL